MSTSDPTGADAGRPSRILHITSGPGWSTFEAAGGSGFTDPSLESEGFIHCSTIDQMLTPANERFAGRHDLVLLVIDVERLSSPLVYEDSYQSGREFPHVYGPINSDSVEAVVDFACGPDGSFVEPDGLRAMLDR